jgi:uncharacterized protein (TIGR02246 family)
MTEVIVSGDTRNEALAPFTAVLAQMELAWNKGNAEGFAQVFGEQADFIDMMGGHSNGRAAIVASHKALLSGAYAKSKIQYKIEKTKPLAPTVMVLFVRSRLTLAGTEGEQIVAARPTLILRKAKDGWRISVFQSTRIRLAPATAKTVAAPEKKPAKKKA